MDDYILITGASGNIGSSIAKSLSVKYPLILCGTNTEKLNEVKAGCESDNQIIWNYDLLDLDGINKSLGNIIKDNGIGVSGFVHSAGVSNLTTLNMMAMSDMQKIMHINFYSAVEILKTLGKKKINGKYLSNVIFISSISSKVGTKGMSAYSASKGALDAFARSMAHELAPKVRVNTILPGGMIENTSASAQVQWQDDERGYLLGCGHADDIASMVEFLLSDRSKWITGQSFIIDGGRTSHY